MRRNIAVNYWWKHPPDTQAEYRAARTLSEIVGLTPKLKLALWPKQIECSPYPKGITMDQVCIQTQASGEEDQLRGGGVCVDEEEMRSGDEDEDQEL